MTSTSDVWTGFANDYDEARPTPPPALLDLLTQLTNSPHPTLVVDLGSGTGLSTAIWNERAAQVIGIEPNAAMRTRATAKINGDSSTSPISYRAGFAHETGLPAACADIVTIAQAFHWMEPAPTLAEIARILRPGGLLAVYDYEWPPALNWELEQEYQQTDARFDKLMAERELTVTKPRWPKHTHLDRIRASGHFRFTRELFLHHVEHGDAARFLAMILSSGYSYHFHHQTITPEEIGFDHLTHVAHQTLGSTPTPWYFSYRVRIAIK